MSEASEVQLLITGFGPFPGVPKNPCTEVLEAYEGQGERLHLPVSYQAAEEFVSARAEPPAALLQLGVATTAERFRLEAKAHNFSSGSPDVAGEVWPAREIEEGAPSWLASPFPVRSFVRENQRELPIELSEHAGDYLCNHLYWRSLRAWPQAVTLFLHIPPFKAGFPLSTYLKVIDRVEAQLRMQAELLAFVPPITR